MLCADVARATKYCNDDGRWVEKVFFGADSICAGLSVNKHKKLNGDATNAVQIP